MKVDYQRVSDSMATLTISANATKLKELKQITLQRLQPDVSAPGFRKGKVPLNIVEKQVDDNYFKSQFIDDALSELYREALKQENLRPLAQPQVEIKKFVPFSDLEFVVTVQVVPPVKLGDYKKIKAKPAPTEVTDSDIDEVINNLRTRLAEKKSVSRALKQDDEALIDFKGVDENGSDVAGASGKDYPLLIGSDSFIDGFESNLIGMKAGEEKTFTLTFPKDYAHKPLANKNVVFTVTLKTVNNVTLPKADASFAKQVGPFGSLDELKEDVRKQLQKQREQEADADVRNSIVAELVNKSSVEVPEVLANENIDLLMSDFKQNLVYRGITLQEYLDQAGITEEDYREKELRPQAEERVKAGLVLAEVAKQEQITVTDEELEIRLQLLKGQHQNDNRMITELNNPEAQNDIASRMATEKTIEKLVEYASK